MSMPRRSRINVADVPQHIIQRGNNRQATFFAGEDYRFYLDHLHEASRKYGCKVYAYVLMTNHVHLLASASKPYDLSHMMQHVGRHFVRYINRVYKRSGTLWEGRFKASLVDTETYFLRCCRYIECNPVRAGMVWRSARAREVGIRELLLVCERRSQCNSANWRVAGEHHLDLLYPQRVPVLLPT